MIPNVKNSNIFALLDIGTSKLVCIIAKVENGIISILGHCHKESKGFIGCNISNLKEAKNSIISVVAEAEKKAKINIDEVLLVISPSQAKFEHYEAVTKISKESVSFKEIEDLTIKIRQQVKNQQREVIHLIPLQYRIDDSLAIENPYHMSGEVLYAKFNVASISQTVINNLENCLKLCQLSISNYFIEPYSSAFCVLNENEMHFGSLLINIGAAFSSFAVVIDNKFTHFGSIPLAGNNITKDIATILNIDFLSAEKIKNLNNSLIISPIEEKELIRISVKNSNNIEFLKINKLELRQIIKCRLEEIIESIQQYSIKFNLPIDAVNNVVITGGVANIIGIDRLAGEIMRKNARIGHPTKIKSILDLEIYDPSYASAIGALISYSRLNFNKNSPKIKEGFFSKIINYFIN